MHICSIFQLRISKISIDIRPNNLVGKYYTLLQMGKLSELPKVTHLISRAAGNVIQMSYWQTCSLTMRQYSQDFSISFLSDYSENCTNSFRSPAFNFFILSLSLWSIVCFGPVSTQSDWWDTYSCYIYLRLSVSLMCFPGSGCNRNHHLGNHIFQRTQVIFLSLSINVGENKSQNLRSLIKTRVAQTLQYC